MRVSFYRWLFLTFAMVLTTNGLHAQQYVVTGDNENGPATSTIFKLTAPTLSKVKSITTGGNGAAQAGVSWLASQRQAVSKHGSGVCIFVADSGSSDIAAFQGATIAKAKKIGRYSDSRLVGNAYGITLAASPNGKVLYAGYPKSVNLAVWKIEADCSLILANILTAHSVIVDMRVSPNGKTLVATFGLGAACSRSDSAETPYLSTDGAATFPAHRDAGTQSDLVSLSSMARGRACELDSFAISGTNLTEKGPFTTGGPFAGGVDITKDSKYTIIGLAVIDTAVDIFPINPDSSLGSVSDFFFPHVGANSNNVWLSPNEKYLFVANNTSFDVTTLNYTEDPPNLTFSCLTRLNNPGLGDNFFDAGIATGSNNGAGSFLYVAESGSKASAVGLLEIDPNTGCTTEVSGSPFLTGQAYGLGSLSAYPGRPF